METATELQRQGPFFLMFFPLQNATRGTDADVRVHVLISSEQIRSLSPQPPLVWPSHELQSTLLKGDYIGDYLGEHHRGLLNGILGV